MEPDPGFSGPVQLQPTANILAAVVGASSTAKCVIQLGNHLVHKFNSRVEGDVDGEVQLGEATDTRDWRERTGLHLK